MPIDSQPTEANHDHFSTAATRKADPTQGKRFYRRLAFPFKVFADPISAVTHTDDNGLETVKTLTTHYTATPNANQNSNPGGTGHDADGAG